MMRPQDYRRAVGSIRWSPAQRRMIEEKLRSTVPEISIQPPDDDDEPIRIPYIQMIYEEQEARMKKERKQARMYLLILAAVLLTIGGTVAAVAWSSRKPNQNLSEESKSEQNPNESSITEDDLSTPLISPNLTDQQDKPEIHRYAQSDSGFFYFEDIPETQEEQMERLNNPSYFRKSDNAGSNYVGLKYFDEKSKQSIYVCAKPNCLHDKNEFCTATSKNYTALSYPVYLEGYIYYIALDKTEWLKNPDGCTKFPTILLRCTPDGTELTPVTQLYLSENPYSASAELIAHRGQLWINCYYQEFIEIKDSNLQITDSEYRGKWDIYCYEPVQKKLTTLSSSGEPKKDYRPENDHVIGEETNGRNLKGIGDYVYFHKRMSTWQDSIKKSGVYRIDCRTGLIEQVLNIKSQKSIFYTISGDYIFYNYNEHPSNTSDYKGKLVFRSYNMKTGEETESQSLLSIAKTVEPRITDKLLEGGSNRSKLEARMITMLAANEHLYVFWAIDDRMTWSQESKMFVTEFDSSGNTLLTVNLDQSKNMEFPDETIRADLMKNGYFYETKKWIAPDSATEEDMMYLRSQGCWETPDGEWIHPSTLRAEDIDHYIETGFYAADYVYYKPEELTEEIIQRAIENHADDLFQNREYNSAIFSYDGEYFWMNTFGGIMRMKPDEFSGSLNAERVLFW